MFLYHGHVIHQRLFPQRYRFQYQVFQCLLDIDRLADLPRLSRWFAYNRWNVVSFYDRDHGARSDQPLRPWIEQILQQRGIDLAGGKIWLLCFPRILGYTFNPLSVWYCYHADGRLCAILAEVNNTFGDAHSYLLHADPPGQVMSLAHSYSADKCLHVSPFIGMQAQYQFRFTEPQQHLRISINEYSEQQLMLLATLDSTQQPLSHRQLTLSLLKYPLVTLKVIVMIHWQALKIWWQGGQFHRRPPPPEHEVS